MCYIMFVCSPAEFLPLLPLSHVQLLQFTYTVRVTNNWGFLVKPYYKGTVSQDFYSDFFHLTTSSGPRIERISDFVKHFWS
jgi:hypothetical protein